MKDFISLSRWSMSLLAFVCIGQIFVPGSSLSAPEINKALVIKSVFIDWEKNHLVIFGNNLSDDKEPKKVVLGETDLQVILSEKIMVVAILPNPIDDGDYRLYAFTKEESVITLDSYDLTIGAVGPQGEQGERGLRCWDLNGNGIANPDEDTNSNDVVDVLDCKSPQGEQGPQGIHGPRGDQGPPCEGATLCGNQVDPTGPENGSERALRGDGWSSAAGNHRSANRGAGYPDSASVSNNSGFRVVFSRTQ